MGLVPNTTLARNSYFLSLRKQLQYKRYEYPETSRLRSPCHMDRSERIRCRVEKEEDQGAFGYHMYVKTPSRKWILQPQLPYKLTSCKSEMSCLLSPQNS